MSAANLSRASTLADSAVSIRCRFDLQFESELTGISKPIYNYIIDVKVLMHCVIVCHIARTLIKSHPLPNTGQSEGVSAHLHAMAKAKGLEARTDSQYEKASQRKPN